MAKKNPLLGITLDQTAEDRAKEHVGHFTEALVTEAKSLVFQEHGKLVTPVHVDRALRHIEERPKADWRPDAGKILGGTFIGIAVPGFLMEVQDGAAKMNVGFLTIYALIGVVGSIFISLSFRR